MPDDQPVKIPATIRVCLPNGQVEEMPLDEYLKGVVPCEMGLQKPLQALKAQAIAARSFASTSRRHGRDGYDMCSTTHCQVYNPQRRYSDADRAVDETSEMVAIYGGQIIGGVFFGHCDGRTRSSEEAWSGAVAYLRSVPCICGYTTLYGHGVGMCQRGAVAMAVQQSASFEQIMKHYYTGIEIVQAKVVSRGELKRSIVTGQVTDGLGQPRQGLRLVLSGPAGSLDKGTTSDGHFWFTGLPAGRWELRVKDKPVGYGNLFTDGRSIVEIQVAVPELPPLTLSAAPLPGPRRLVGTLGYDGVPVAVADAQGNEWTLISGSVPGSGRGSFEVPLPTPGTYALRILDRHFDLEVGDEGLQVQLSAGV
jgi:Stage II sporulation protein